MILAKRLVKAWRFMHARQIPAVLIIHTWYHNRGVTHGKECIFH